MLNNINLVKILIKRNLVFSIIFLMEIVVCFFIVTLAYNRYNEQSHYINITDKPYIKSSIAFFYQPNPYSNNQKSLDESLSAVEFVNGQLKENNYFSSSESVQMNRIGNESQMLGIINYGETTLKMLAPKIKEGRLPEPTKSMDEIEVVQLENRNSKKLYRIGETINIPQNVNPESKEGANLRYNKMIVVGTVAKEDVVILSTGQSMYEGVGLSLSEIFVSNQKLRDSFLTSVPESIDKNTNFVMVYLKESTPEKELLKIRDILRQNGSAYTMQELKKETYNVMNLKLERDKPILVMVVFIFVTGVIGLSVLNTKKNQKTLAIFNQLGASKGECLLIFFFSFFVLIVLGIILFRLLILLAYFFDMRQGVRYFRVTSQFTLWLWVVSFIISLISFIPMWLTIQLGRKR